MHLRVRPFLRTFSVRARARVASSISEVSVSLFAAGSNHQGHEQFSDIMISGISGKAKMFFYEFFNLVTCPEFAD